MSKRKRQVVFTTHEVLTALWMQYESRWTGAEFDDGEEMKIQVSYDTSTGVLLIEDR